MDIITSLFLNYVILFIVVTASSVIIYFGIRWVIKNIKLIACCTLAVGIILTAIVLIPAHAEEHVVLTTYTTYPDVRDNEIVTVVPYKFHGEIREATWKGKFEGWRYLHLVLDNNGDVVDMDYLEAGN